MSTETRDAPETIADLIDHLRITHGRVRRTYRRPDGCATCHVDWPCPVARLFAALRATDAPEHPQAFEKGGIHNTPRPRATDVPVAEGLRECPHCGRSLDPRPYDANRDEPTARKASPPLDPCCTDTLGMPVPCQHGQLTPDVMQRIESLEANVRDHEEAIATLDAARKASRGSGLDAREWKRIEDRFWSEESKWAEAGSGMTKEQQTGATMLLLWLRDPSGGGLQSAAALDPTP